MKTALVVGGTGPSGPFLVHGLQERGYTVPIFHRETHEIPEIPDDVEHIHGDPHFRKIRQHLGYRDLLPPEEALRRTVRWYVEHQPERGGDIEQRLQDAFDYETEDHLAAIYRDAMARARAFHRETVPTPHPYPHSKEPGLARDHRNRCMLAHHSQRWRERFCQDSRHWLRQNSPQFGVSFSPTPPSYAAGRPLTGGLHRQVEFYITPGGSKARRITGPAARRTS